MIGKKINQLATELAPVSTDLTIIGDPTTGVSKKITLAQLGAIFSGAVSFYTNLAGFPATGDINVIYCAKDTQKLYLWSGSAYVEVFPSQALLDTYQLRSEKGNANGYASLDSQGKVPISQLPSSIMEYKGTWNASTNTPTLANGTGDTGDVYICNVAGTVNFGAGPITFAVGDYVIYSGTIWQRSSGAVGTVTSVAVSRSGDALAITGSPVTTSGTINIGFAGNSTQYINGAGNLVTFPGVINEAQNLITEVYNKTGATLTKGTVVYINGGQGNLPAVTKALATGDSTSAQTYGIVRNDITNNNNGYVVVAGRISDLDTQAYTEGTQLYLSPTTAGTFTSTKPYAPQHLVYVGIVVRAHPTQGVVEVKIQNGYELDELHNVAAQSPSNGDILQYVSSTSLWTKVAGTTSNIAEGSNLYYTDARSRAALSFTAGSGAYNSTTGVITIPTNTNQLTNGAAFITLASLSAGAGISYNNTTGVIASTITQYTDAMARAAISLTTTGTSGAATYNSTTGVLNVPQYAPDLSGYVPTSRTLTINGTAYDLSANRSWSVGTVTSVGLSSATSGVTIGSTPITTNGTITLAIATASGSQQGLLSSTDWTTFNNKQSALTNPVTGTGTTNYLPKFTGTSTIGNSQIFDNGTQLAINTGSPSGFGTQRFLVVGSAASQVARFTDGANGDLVFDFPSATISRITAQYGTGGVLVFANGTGFNEQMRLNASGNLSLGNTNDSYKLDVNGTGRFTAGTGDAIIIGNLAANYIKLGGIASSNTYLYSFESNFNIGNTYSGGTLNLYAGNANRVQIASTGAATFSSSVTTGSLTANGVATFTRSTKSIFLNPNVVDENTTSLIDVTSGMALAFGIGGSERMRITSGGNVGIGSTTASGFTRTLKINTASGTAGLLLADGDTDRAGFYIDAGTTAPAYLFTNDSKPLVLSVAGAERMRITSGGNVGIGSASPAQLLTIQNTSSNPYLSIIGGASATMGVLMGTTGNTVDGQIIYSNSTQHMAFVTASAERMRITSGGLVGIGTSSPSTTFTVKSTNDNGYALTRPSDATSLHWRLSTTETGGDAYTTRYNTFNNEMLFTTYAAGGTGGNIIWRTSASGGSGSEVERMRITSGGNVGIGYSAPDFPLAVFGTNVAQGDSSITAHFIDKSSFAAGVGGGISFGGYFSSTSYANSFAYIQGIKENGTSGDYAGALKFGTRVNGGSVTERLRITSVGNIEIATGSIKTGEPDTGWGRAAIKIGASVSGTAFNVTRYLPVSVDGTVYYINLNSSTP